MRYLQLGLIAVLGVAPWTIVAAEEPKAKSPPTEAKEAEKPTKKLLSGAGEFVSYQDGALTLKTRGGTSVWKNIGENFKTFERDEDGRPTRPKGTVEALNAMQVGMAVRIDAEKSEIYFSVDEQTHGTFVSYKDGRLTLIGRAEELGGSFAKKYGTTLRPMIDPQTPVHESIDGGEFKLIGTAEVLSSVREGAIVTLRGKNDTIGLIQIGMPKKK